MLADIFPDPLVGAGVAFRPAPGGPRLAAAVAAAALGVVLDADAGETVTPRMTFARAGLESFAARLAKRVDRTAREADIAWHDGHDLPHRCL